MDEKYIQGIFEEYRILSTEMQQRVDRQEKLSHLSVVSSGALISAYVIIVNNDSLAPILLMFPIIYCIIILLILRHDTMLRTIADYISNNLKIKLNKELETDKDSSIWEWEKYRYTSQLKSGFINSLLHRFLALTRYLIPYLFSISSILLFLSTKNFKFSELDKSDWILLSINIVILILTLILMASWVLQSPNQITNENED